MYVSISTGWPFRIVGRLAPLLNRLPGGKIEERIAGNDLQ